MMLPCVVMVHDGSLEPTKKVVAMASTNGQDLEVAGRKFLDRHSELHVVKVVMILMLSTKQEASTNTLELLGKSGMAAPRILALEAKTSKRSG